MNNFLVLSVVEIIPCRRARLCCAFSLQDDEGSNFDFLFSFIKKNFCQFLRIYSVVHTSFHFYNVNVKEFIEGGIEFDQLSMVL